MVFGVVRHGQLWSGRYRHTVMRIRQFGTAVRPAETPIAPHRANTSSLARARLRSQARAASAAPHRVQVARDICDFLVAQLGTVL
jgi:hypothetical protein